MVSMCHLCVDNHVVIVACSLVEWSKASSFVSCLYVVVSCRWIRQSVMYWLYVTVHGSRPLLELGNNRLGLAVIERRIRAWKGRRLERECLRLNRVVIFVKKLSI